MLATVERLKGMLPGEDEDWLKLQIAAASIAIENYCKRTFKKQLYTELVSGHATSNYLNLRNYPVHEVIKITNDLDFGILDDGRLYRAGGWPAGEHNIQVSYIGGYVLPGDATKEEPRTLPEPLELACLMYAKILCERYAMPADIQSERLGEMSVTYAHQLSEKDIMPPAVIALISPYVGRWC